MNVCLLAAYQMLDALTTYAFTQLGGVEAHPYLRYLIEMGRWDLFIAGKLILVVLLSLLIRFYCPKRWRRAAFRIPTITSMLICLWNSAWIIVLSAS